MRRLAPTALCGSVRIPASKSQAHRLLIIAALAKGPTRLRFDGISDDIAATADCLRALGAKITWTSDGAAVSPIEAVPKLRVRLFCRQSGSTLRFLLPLCGILGAEAVFIREGRLASRPLAPFDEQLRAHGMTIAEDGQALFVSGRLQSGLYTLPGNISSQYITGLMLALSQLRQTSTICISTALESADYVKMTQQALHQFGYEAQPTENGYRVGGGSGARREDTFAVEGDFSSAAFFLCAGALSEQGITVSGLQADSAQPDRAIVEILKAFGAEVSWGKDGIFVRKCHLRGITLDCAGFPDLVPVVSILAAAAEGESRLCGCGRLRLKESDRLLATAQMIQSLGGQASVCGDALHITGKKALAGGEVKTYDDHRMAMAAAVAACVCEGEIVIDNDQCVSKSYPRFWEDYQKLKGERT